MSALGAQDTNPKGCTLHMATVKQKQGPRGRPAEYRRGMVSTRGPSKIHAGFAWGRPDSREQAVSPMNVDQARGVTIQCGLSTWCVPVTLPSTLQEHSCHKMPPLSPCYK